MEVWDGRLKDDSLAGIDLIRDEVIPEGLYHGVSEIIVRHIDGDFLAMRRSPNKTYGGLYEITAGGSVLKGETYEEAAIREVYEEAGVITKEVQPLYTVLHEDYHTIFHGFLVETDMNKDQVKLQEGETDHFLWIKSKNVIDFLTTSPHGQPFHKRTLNALKKFYKYFFISLKFHSSFVI